MRKLNLGILESFDGNVTLGFKTSASQKLQLIQSAQKEGTSLSKYVNDVVTNFPSELRRLREENIALKKKVSSFELPELFALFEKCKGQNASLTEEGGNRKNIVIDSVLDLQEVIVKSFQVK